MVADECIWLQKDADKDADTDTAAEYWREGACYEKSKSEIIEWIYI